MNEIYSHRSMIANFMRLPYPALPGGQVVLPLEIRNT
jgi:hypothetical protein